MAGRHNFDDERPNPKKITANLNELIQQITNNLSTLTEYATGSAFHTRFSLMDELKSRSSDDKVKEHLAAVEKLMEKLAENVDSFRLVKEEIEEKSQTALSDNIKKLSDSLDGVINHVKRSRFLMNIETYQIDLADIQKRLTYSWKALQPYEPPKLSQKS